MRSSTHHALRIPHSVFCIPHFQEEPKMTQQRLSRRSFLQMTALSSLGVALAACAPAAPAAQTGAAGEAASTAGQPAQIRFHARIGVQGDYYTAMAEQFNAEQSDIAVTVEAFPGDGYYQKIATMIAGDTIGDAMWTASIINLTMSDWRNESHSGKSERMNQRKKTRQKLKDGA
jgi:hypothetical protein